MKNIVKVLLLLALSESASGVSLDSQQKSNVQEREALQSMTRVELLAGIKAMSANSAVNQLGTSEKTLMKT